MSFSYGFFNAINLDRVYTAEDFTAYLSSLICNGILDTYRQCFAPTVKNLSVTFGTGKAWINGHYLISDTLHTVDCASYVDESLDRYVVIACSATFPHEPAAFAFSLELLPPNLSFPRSPTTM